jgi:hypothetical protein
VDNTLHLGKCPFHGVIINYEESDTDHPLANVFLSVPAYSVHAWRAENEEEFMDVTWIFKKVYYCFIT